MAAEAQAQAEKDVTRQIRQMVDFIKLEAREKANELRTKTKADADLEKQMAVLNAKTKLAEEFDKKEKALATEQKIKASMEENKQRQRLLSARDEYIQRLAGEAKGRLASAAASNASVYNSLLKGLVKQGLLRLEGENAVEVFARPQDLAVVQKAAVAAAQEVAAEARAAGGSREVSVTVTADPALGTSAGGVVLAGAKGRIRCNNTLEERLTLVMGDLQPAVRDLLFPSARAEVRVKPPVNVNPHAHAPAPAPAPKPAAAPAAAKGAGGRPAAPAGGDPFAFGSGGAAGGAAPAPAADPFAF